MMERELTDLLNSVADEVRVGPAPLGAVETRARGLRRRRIAGYSAASLVALGALVGGFTVVTQDEPNILVLEGPNDSGVRLVGVGHAAIAVPAAWPTMELECPGALYDSVVFDDGSATTCTPVPGPTAGVEIVRIVRGEPALVQPVEQAQINGVEVQRQVPRCNLVGDVSTCTGAVYIPSESVTFLVTSTTDPQTVHRLLDSIRIVPDRVGVPDSQTVNVAERGNAANAYIKALEGLGLSVEVTNQWRPKYPTGWILGVSPEAGTMLAPGSMVTLTVVGGPDPGESSDPQKPSLGISELPAWSEGCLDSYKTEGGICVPPVTDMGDPIIPVADLIRSATVTLKSAGATKVEPIDIGEQFTALQGTWGGGTAVIWVERSSVDSLADLKASRVFDIDGTKVSEVVQNPYDDIRQLWFQHDGLDWGIFVAEPNGLASNAHQTLRLAAQILAQ